MSGSLFDRNGVRKYLTARERLAFVYVASQEKSAVATFCLTVAFIGARISEVLALTINRIDAADESNYLRDPQAAKEDRVSSGSGAKQLSTIAHGLRGRQRWEALAVGSNDRLENYKVGHAKSGRRR